MRNPVIDSIADAERQAQRTLPKSVFVALQAGNEHGVTRADNVTAFSEVGWLPRVGDAPPVREQSTTVMGRRLSMPVFIAPTGILAVHPGGEVAVARAAAAKGTVMSVSAFATRPVEEVVAANPETLFQAYWTGGRSDMAQLVERARAAGVKGFILTLDWSFSFTRDWGTPHIPDDVDLRTMGRFASEVVRRPRWLVGYARSGSLPGLTVPNMVPLGTAAPTYNQAYAKWMHTPPPTWEDIAWIRELWGGPFMVKGVMRVDDARRAVDAGATAISVSNHGGNNLDGTPASLRALPLIADAVGHEIEVVLDGGIRRGGDAVKALALGARAVMIGRAYLWSLAARGQAGIEDVFDILRAGIDSSLLGLGRASIEDLTPEDVVLPRGFVRQPEASLHAGQSQRR